MNWIGITNENEFYSQHYLSEIFTGDVRGVPDAWSAKEKTESREAKAARNRTGEPLQRARRATAPNTESVGKHPSPMPAPYGTYSFLVMDSRAPT